MSLEPNGSWLLQREASELVVTVSWRASERRVRDEVFDMSTIDLVDSYGRPNAFFTRVRDDRGDRAHIFGRIRR